MTATKPEVLWEPDVDQLDALPPGTVIQLDHMNDDFPDKRPRAAKVTRHQWDFRDGRATSPMIIRACTFKGIEILERGEWVTEPGIHLDMDEDRYHGDPVEAGSLSVSRLKTLIQPGGPARFAWDRTHPRGDRPEFDFGHAAHALVLGAGAPLHRLSYDDMRSKAAKEEASTARAKGAVPLKPKEYDQVVEMAAAIESTPGAQAALAGEPEVSAFRQDDESGLWLRARFDVLGDHHLGDYKTAVSADPDTFARKAYEFGYDMQAAHYLATAVALGAVPADAPFRFVVQEKTAPYLVSVIELDQSYLEIGTERVRRAIDLYAACVAAGDWPGYPADVVTVGPPRWATSPLTSDGATALDPDLEQQMLALMTDQKETPR
ncbi:MAG: PD-(D/E)XK nuclease-like domain-containing protein [Propionibacteriales bacterium]|nr:PD-(D/E)XK nuclease-like domain-containing protein [Propionibacteriales bacterium]